jgi:probable rRNA maturation factor
MRVTFENRQTRFDAAFRRRAERIVREVADACWAKVSVARTPTAGGMPACEPEAHVSFVGPRVMRGVNRGTRGVDASTDVLSFPMLEMVEGKAAPFHAEDLLPSPGGGPSILFLGDVLMSLDRAVEQAARYGHPVEREIAFLAAHSFLHLLGYDHDTPERERRMRSRQRSVLLPLGYRRNSP